MGSACQSTVIRFQFYVISKLFYASLYIYLMSIVADFSDHLIVFSVLAQLTESIYWS